MALSLEMPNFQFSSSNDQAYAYEFIFQSVIAAMLIAYNSTIAVARDQFLDGLFVHKKTGRNCYIATIVVCLFDGWKIIHYNLIISIWRPTNWPAFRFIEFNCLLCIALDIVVVRTHLILKYILNFLDCHFINIFIFNVVRKVRRWIHVSAYFFFFFHFLFFFLIYESISIALSERRQFYCFMYGYSVLH